MSGGPHTAIDAALYWMKRAQTAEDALRDINERISHFADHQPHPDMPMLSLLCQTARIVRDALLRGEHL